MRVLWPALVICLLSLTPQEPAAANQIGVVSGVVVDQENGVIPGATVTLRAGERFERTAITNVRGEFRFENVPSGSYALEASLPGFVSLTTAVTVADQPLAPLRLALKIGTMQETVTVAAATPLLQAASGFGTGQGRNRCFLRRATPC